MAAYFSLAPKIDPGHCASFQSVDDNMREALGFPPDPKNWLNDWYDVIGLGLAMGYSFDRLREKIVYDDPLGIRICNWLEANYYVDAWRGR